MGHAGQTWAIVLAAGEGSRLRTLTTTPSGIAIPKQFCSLRGGPSLLHEALRRAERICDRQRICAVVAREHRQWWGPALAWLPPGNVIAQPENRGTGIGILLPLLHIIERDPDARIVLLPSDHQVLDERGLCGSIAQAISRLAPGAAELHILGVKPENADPDLGYIVPGRDDGHGVRTVERFVEKPPTKTARRLIRNGALWNIFIVASRAQTLLALFESRLPGVVVAMREAIARDTVSPAQASAMRELYRTLPAIDFSRDVVQGRESALRVVAVPRCGWSDLGTPARVARALARMPGPAAYGRDVRLPLSGCLDLSMRHAELEART